MLTFGFPVTVAGQMTQGQPQIALKDSDLRAATLKELNQEWLDARFIKMKTYSPGVLKNQDYEGDELLQIRNSSSRKLPEIRVRTKSGWKTVSTCKELFEIRGSQRMEVDTRGVDLYTYTFCDSDMTQIALKSPNFNFMDYQRAFFEYIKTVPLMTQRLSDSMINRLNSIPSKNRPDQMTFVDLWPFGAHLVDLPQDYGRLMFRYTIRLSLADRTNASVTIFGAYLVAFGDFDGDGIGDMIVSVSEESKSVHKPLSPDCLNQSIIQVTRLAPDAPLTAHPIAHMHNICRPRPKERRSE